MNRNQDNRLFLNQERFDLTIVGGKDRRTATVATFTAWIVVGSRRFGQMVSSDMKDCKAAIGIFAKACLAHIHEHVWNQEE